MFIYIIRQILILGLVAGVLWLLPVVFEGRFEVTLDVFFVLMVSTLLVGFFLVAICIPLAKLLQGRVGRALFYLSGAAIGPLAVLAYLRLSMSLDAEWSQYVVRFWREHLIFAFVGLVFFIGLYKKTTAINDVKGSAAN